MMKLILFVVSMVVLMGRISCAQEKDMLNWAAAYGEERLSTVIVSGKLLCTPKPSRHPYPVSGASVGVFCGTSGKKRKSWVKGSTNSFGEFLLDIPSHLHAIPNLEKICVVEVLHIPTSSPCKHGFTGKRKGIHLTSITEGVRIYTTTRNIHLMPKPRGKYFKPKHTAN